MLPSQAVCNTVDCTNLYRSFKAHLGPVASRLKDVPPNPRKDGLGYNPRCLRRDINPESSKFTSENYTYDLITENKDIYSFQTLMQGEMQRSNPGVHGGGHTTVGGDPGGVSNSHSSVSSLSVSECQYG